MRTLHHQYFSASCRMVRLCLAEKSLEIDKSVQVSARLNQELLDLNPSGDLPMLIEPDGTTLIGRYIITEYLEDVYPASPLLTSDPVNRAEIRRLISWFDERFSAEVTGNLVGEKILKRLDGGGEPRTEALREGRKNIHYHLDYVGYLAHHRNWLAGDALSLADFAAAAHLSAVDYLGDVPWADHPEAGAWYARIKSRPSFRSLLEDRLAGMPPASHYADLDF